MSKVYVVSYDLNKSGQDYKGLYEKLEVYEFLLCYN
jgi:hypothetical protein